MRKIFKMANAELSKIFMRPSMFVLFTVLVVALVLSFLFFEPTVTSTKFEYSDGFAGKIYTNFQSDYSDFEQDLINAKIDIFNYLDEDNDTCELFKKQFRDLDSQFNAVRVSILKVNNLYPTAEERYEICTEYTKFKEKVYETRAFMRDKIKDKYTNIFITIKDYDYLYRALTSVQDLVPSSEGIAELSRSEIVKSWQLINDSFNISELSVEVNGYEKIEIDSVMLEQLLNKYYYTNIIETNDGEIEYTHTGRLEELYDEVISYYTDELGSENSSDSQVLATFNDKISNFYDYIKICSSLLSKNFEVLRIGNKSDDEIATYNGFSGVSTYSLKNDIVTYEYLYNNNTFAYEYLRGFNFNTNSGTTTNAFDFSFFAMQILSALITLFVIFFACGSLSGEQNAGTLKMVALRPFTRNKLYSGKFFACFNVAMLLMLISFTASFVVGVAMYGFTASPVLVAVNASSVLTISPFVLMLLYFASLLVDIIFYISLALLISMIIKPTVISTAITSAVLIASTVISGISSSSAIRYIPSLNTGLFKFVTQSQLGLFSFNVVPNITLWSSVFMLLASIFVSDIMGRLLFTHRSLDK